MAEYFLFGLLFGTSIGYATGYLAGEKEVCEVEKYIIIEDPHRRLKIGIVGFVLDTMYNRHYSRVDPRIYLYDTNRLQVNVDTFLGKYLATSKAQERFFRHFYRKYLTRKYECSIIVEEDESDINNN
jgi:hypothetical protein